MAAKIRKNGEIWVPLPSEINSICEVEVW